MNILVLTDFSPASAKAYDYSCSLAKALPGNIFQLHIISPRKTLDTEAEKAKAIAQAREKMKTDSKMPSSGNEISINQIATIGKLEPTLNRICKDFSIDLIILGTRKKHSLMDYLLGSVSTIIINKVNAPVIIVPEETSFSAFQKIAIATEQDEYDTPLFRFLKKLTPPFDASINRVFVFPLPRDFSTEKEEKYNPTWMEEEPNPEAEITIIRDLSTIRGLDYFINKYQIDLLAMSIPKRTGLEKIFHRSLSKRMIYHSTIPLLIWNEESTVI